METTGKKRNGETETGGVCAALGEGRGSINEAGGDKSPTVGGPKRGNMGVAAIMRYVRSNMEDPLWVSRVLVGRTSEPS